MGNSIDYICVSGEQKIVIEVEQKSIRQSVACADCSGIGDDTTGSVDGEGKNAAVTPKELVKIDFKDGFEYDIKAIFFCWHTCIA